MPKTKPPLDPICIDQSLGVMTARPWILPSWRRWRKILDEHLDFSRLSQADDLHKLGDRAPVG